MTRVIPLTNGAQRLKALIRQQEKAQAPSLLAASVTASLVAAAAVILLGLSGWFITSAALAGLAGPAVAKAFNYLIPSALIRLLAIVRTASRYGERMTGHRAALNALAVLRPRIFEGLTQSSVKNSLSLSSGEASARLMQDVDAVQNHFVRRSAPWGALSALGAGLGMAALSGWYVALVVLASSLLGMGLSALIAHHLAQPASRAIQEASGALKAEFAAMSAAAPELQAYGARDWAIDRINAKGEVLDEAARKLARVGSLMLSAQSVALSLAIAGIVLTGPIGTPPLMALALLAAVTTIEGASALMNALRQAGGVEAAVERLGELMPATDAKEPQAANLGTEISLTTCGLSLLPPERLAISGRSGSGKTTLVERWMHLRPVICGETQLGGLDISLLSPSTARSLFAYAPQQPMLLAGTLRSNLMLAHPEATEQDLWHALETADLADLVRRLPKGLDTRLGENGARLSGGEKRRLGLARAYLRPAPWLVLDEPTEGLDAMTEARVLVRLEQHLNRSHQGLIVISHRPDPLQMCKHQIIVSDIGLSGRISLQSNCLKQVA